jgi:hypothetical protein
MRGGEQQDGGDRGNMHRAQASILPAKRGASIGWAGRKVYFSDVEKYTHFDAELPFDTAKDL